VISRDGTRAEQFITVSDNATGERIDPIVLQISLSR